MHLARLLKMSLSRYLTSSAMKSSNWHKLVLQAKMVVITGLSVKPAEIQVIRGGAPLHLVT